MSYNIRSVGSSPLTAGKTKAVFGSTMGAETINWGVVVEADTVLVSVFVEAISSGTIDIKVYTYAEVGKELEIISFPTITAPTTALLIEKAAVSLTNIRIEAVATGDVTLDIRAKGLTLGESSTRILSATAAEAFSKTVTTTAGVLVPSSNTDRQGLIVKNFGTGTLYIGYELAEAVSTEGYPIGAGESIGIDIASGVTVYAIADATTDVRIMQAGN